MWKREFSQVVWEEVDETQTERFRPNMALRFGMGGAYTVQSLIWGNTLSFYKHHESAAAPIEVSQTWSEVKKTAQLVWQL